MRKVTWPSRSELMSSTVVVIAVSVFTALVIFLLDTIFSTLLGFILR
jgi:preprotein translocase SecE subunit